MNHTRTVDTISRESNVTSAVERSICVGTISIVMAIVCAQSTFIVVYKKFTYLKSRARHAKLGHKTIRRKLIAWLLPKWDIKQ